MNTFFVVDIANYRGWIETTINTDKAITDNLNNCLVSWMDGMTFEQYQAKHGGKLSIITQEEYAAMRAKYVLALQEDFNEISLDKYYEALNCLPPLRFTSQYGKEMFFIGECYTDNLYQCYVKIADKCYTALRAINTPRTDIFNLKSINHGS